MKKLLALILILALLLPAAALAAEKDVVGCWASYELQKDGAPAMIMIYLAENHTCFFLAQSFNPDDEGFGRAFVGTWQMNDDGSVTAKTGNNTETAMLFDDSYSVAYDPRTNHYFICVDLLFRGE